MKFILYIYCLLGMLLWNCQRISNKNTDTWSDKKIMRKANTARFAFYMSKEERESIRQINFIRINPVRFAKNGYLKYLVKNEIIKSIDDMDFVKNLSYHSSLYTHLLMLKPSERLRPSLTLYLSARQHAKWSGKNNYEGHDGEMLFEDRLLRNGNFNYNVGENCSYGEEEPFETIMQLLIDEGVPSLGHRTNLLNRNFIRVGCAYRPHKEYEINYVQDFSSGNYFERIFRKKNKNKIKSKLNFKNDN